MWVGPVTFYFILFLHKFEQFTKFCFFLGGRPAGGGGGWGDRAVEKKTGAYTGGLFRLEFLVGCHTYIK